LVIENLTAVGEGELLAAVRVATANLPAVRSAPTGSACCDRGWNHQCVADDAEDLDAAIGEGSNNTEPVRGDVSVVTSHRDGNVLAVPEVHVFQVHAANRRNCVPVLQEGISVPQTEQNVDHSSVGHTTPSSLGAEGRVDHRGRVNVSDPEQKRLLRALGGAFVSHIFQTSGVRPTALIVDALGPDGRLFADELLARGVHRKHLFSPNQDPGVVAAGRALDLPFAVEAAALDFVVAHEAALAARGGVDLAFLDVHGRFEDGALPLFRSLVERRLLRGRAGCGTLVCFAVSDLFERFQNGGTRRAEIARDLLDTVAAVVRDSESYVHWPLERLPDALRPFYSRTMAVYAFRVVHRAHVAPAIGRPVYHLDADDADDPLPYPKRRRTYDAVTLNF
jgi:hypothetical protein